MRRLSLAALLALLVLGLFARLVTMPTDAGMIFSSVGGGGPTGSCTQSTAFFARVYALPTTTLDGAVGSSGPLKAYDDLICNLVSDGIWTTLDGMWVLATNTATGTNTAVAALNLVSSSFTITSTGSPTFTADAGYTGGSEGSTVYLDTHYNPSVNATNYSLNLAHLSAWTLTNHQSTGFNGIAGASDGTNADQLIPWATNGNVIAGVNENGSTLTAAPVTASTGSTVAVRVNSSAGGASIYRNGVALSPVGVVRTAIPNTDLAILSVFTGAGGAPYQVSVVTIGGSLTATQIANPAGTTGTGLVPRICTYLTAVHGSC